VDGSEVSKCRFLGVILSLEVHPVTVAGHTGKIIMVGGFRHATHPEILSVNWLILDENKLVQVKRNLLASTDLEGL
jgi:hypothetical protein